MHPLSGSVKKTPIILFVAVLVVAIVVGGTLYFNGLLNKINRVSGVTTRIPPSMETFEQNAEGPDTVKPEEVLFDVDSIGMMDDDDVKNILLIGQDRREGEERQRSDSMIICSINTRENRVTLCSLMRDMYVPIPGYSANRINAAYAFGGMELLDETVEQDFGVPIHGNVEVDFEGFISALEVVGNIEMELTEEEAEYLNGVNWYDMGLTDEERVGWDLKPGKNELTPAQALGFARTRMVGNSDWERTDRQRRVIMAAFNKVKESNTAQLLLLADKIFPFITTDMSNSELLSYVKTISVAGIDELDSYRLPVDGHYSSENINGMAVLVPDLVMNSQFLKQYLYGADVDEDLVTKDYVPHAQEELNSSRTTQPQTTTQTTQTYQPAPEPVFYEPVTTPVVTEAPVQPVYVEPVPEEPVIEDPGTGDTGTTDPGAGDTGTTDPDTTDPGTGDTGTTDPGTGDTGTTEPDPGTGGGGEEPVIEQPPAETGGGEAEGG